MNKNRAILQINGYRVHPDLFGTRFACDLGSCKGACCTMPGGSGAPVDEQELPILESAWERVHTQVPRQHADLVERKGLFVLEKEGWTIRCLDHRACVFVTYEKDGVAICSIQRAYQRGEFGWPKPASCHLFPLRRRGEERNLLVFEEYSECAAAMQLGEREGVPLYSFLEEAIRRVFGDEFFDALSTADAQYSLSEETED